MHNDERCTGGEAYKDAERATVEVEKQLAKETKSIARETELKRKEEVKNKKELEKAAHLLETKHSASCCEEKEGCPNKTKGNISAEDTRAEAQCSSWCIHSN